MHFNLLWITFLICPFIRYLTNTNLMKKSSALAILTMSPLIHKSLQVTNSFTVTETVLKEEGKRNYYLKYITKKELKSKRKKYKNKKIKKIMRFRGRRHN